MFLFTFLPNNAVFLYFLKKFLIILFWQSAAALQCLLEGRHGRDVAVRVHRGPEHPRVGGSLFNPDNFDPGFGSTPEGKNNFLGLRHSFSLQGTYLIVRAEIGVRSVRGCSKNTGT